MLRRGIGWRHPGLLEWQLDRRVGAHLRDAVADVPADRARHVVDLVQSIHPVECDARPGALGVRQRAVPLRPVRGARAQVDFVTAVAAGPAMVGLAPDLVAQRVLVDGELAEARIAQSIAGLAPAIEAQRTRR